MLTKKEKQGIMAKAFNECINQKERNKSVYWDEKFMIKVINSTEQKVREKIFMELQRVIK